MGKKFIIILIVIIFLSSLKHNNISNKISKTISENRIEYNYIEKKEKPIGSIIIQKIKVNNYLYDIKSSNNNVDKNVTILYKNNHIMVLAAHSGNDKISYFKNLNQLKTNDKIIINLNNKKHEYIVENIWEEEKNGTIEFEEKQRKQLILTTCSPTNKKKQLIISCTEKEQ